MQLKYSVMKAGDLSLLQAEGFSGTPRSHLRGNKEGVNAEFSTDEEKLAFEIKTEGEIDYHDNHSYPDHGLMQVLEESTDAIDMYA